MSGTTCYLCPRRCGVIRNEKSDFVKSNGTVHLPGFCQSPLEPVVARAALHHWEEPVISGSNGSGAIFFTGCNLQCVFCQNSEISCTPAGKSVSPVRLREIYDQLIAEGAHNINLVTPMQFTDAILQSLEKPLPVPVVWNSNGYELPESLRKLQGRIQIYLPDLKYADNALAARWSHAPDYFETAVSAIMEMYSQTGKYQIGEDGLLRSGVVIRHLILPGCVENSKRVIDFVATTFRPGEVLFSLMRQYLPCGRVSETSYPELNRRVSDSEYQEVEQYLFNSSIEDGFVQDADSASQDFIPHFDGTGV